MSNFKEQLISRMIRLYGFEHPIVISFCEWCDRYEDNEWNDCQLKLLVRAHEEDPLKF